MGGCKSKSKESFDENIFDASFGESIIYCQDKNNPAKVILQNSCSKNERTQTSQEPNQKLNLLSEDAKVSLEGDKIVKVGQNQLKNLLILSNEKLQKIHLENQDLYEKMASNFIFEYRKLNQDIRKDCHKIASLFFWNSLFAFAQIENCENINFPEIIKEIKRLSTKKVIFGSENCHTSNKSDSNLQNKKTLASKQVQPTSENIIKCTQPKCSKIAKDRFSDSKTYLNNLSNNKLKTNESTIASSKARPKESKIIQHCDIIPSGKSIKKEIKDLKISEISDKFNVEKSPGRQDMKGTDKNSNIDKQLKKNDADISKTFQTTDTANKKSGKQKRRRRHSKTRENESLIEREDNVTNFKTTEVSAAILSDNHTLKTEKVLKNKTDSELCTNELHHNLVEVEHLDKGYKIDSISTQSLEPNNVLEKLVSSDINNSLRTCNLVTEKPKTLIDIETAKFANQTEQSGFRIDCERRYDLSTRDTPKKCKKPRKQKTDCNEFTNKKINKINKTEDQELLNLSNDLYKKTPFKRDNKFLDLKDNKIGNSYLNKVDASDLDTTCSTTDKKDDTIQPLYNDKRFNSLRKQRKAMKKCRKI